jgi:hypothetical protein
MSKAQKGFNLKRFAQSTESNLDEQRDDKSVESVTESQLDDGRKDAKPKLVENALEASRTGGAKGITEAGMESAGLHRGQEKNPIRPTDAEIKVRETLQKNETPNGNNNAGKRSVDTDVGKQKSLTHPKMLNNPRYDNSNSGFNAMKNKAASVASEISSIQDIDSEIVRIISSSSDSRLTKMQMSQIDALKRKKSSMVLTAATKRSSGESAMIKDAVDDAKTEVSAALSVAKSRWPEDSTYIVEDIVKAGVSRFLGQSIIREACWETLESIGVGAKESFTVSTPEGAKAIIAKELANDNVKTSAFKSGLKSSIDEKRKLVVESLAKIMANSSIRVNRETVDTKALNAATQQMMREQSGKEEAQD